MIDRRQRLKQRGIAFFVPDIAHFAAEVGRVGFGEQGVDFGLRGGDDGYEGAVLEEGEGGACADALGVVRGGWRMGGVKGKWYPELPPTTATFLPASLSLEFGMVVDDFPH